MPFIRLLLSFCFLAFAFVVPTAHGQAVNQNHARVELISDHAVAVPGSTVWLGLSFEIDRHWHIYWQNAGDAGIPPEITWTETSGLAPEAIGAFRWPVPELLPVVPGEIMDYGYSDRIVLPFPVTIPETADGAILLSGVTDYLICEEICIPERADVRLLLSVGSGQVPDQRGASLINSALERVPATFEGEAAITKRTNTWVLSAGGSALAGARGTARFFPEGHEIVHAADQPAVFGPDGLQLTLTPTDPDVDPETLSGVITVGDVAVAVSAAPGPEISGTRSRVQVNLAALIILALIGGLILNLMPCVLPVLSIKAMGVVASAANGDRAEIRKHGLWYTAGVLLSFAILAAAIVSVRAATGIATWGFWMQNPVIIAGLVLIVFLIGLWLLGMFELGTSVQNVGDGLARQQGSAGAFFTGVLAVVVGAPCTGPFLGAALGSIMAQPAPQVFVVLLAMGLGLALPFLLLSFMPRLQQLMPKPGAWMESLKQVFAFPMFLTAAYFLWTLGDLAGTISVAATVAGATLIGFGIWVLKSDGSGARAILLSLLGIAAILPIFNLMSARSMPEIGVGFVWLAIVVGLFIAAARGPSAQVRQASVLVAVAAILLGIAGPLWQVRAGAPAASASGTYQASYPTEAWSSERVAELVAEGRPIFVDFTATWCVNCQANKRTTLKTEAVSAAFERGNVAFLVADYTRPDPKIAAELQRRNRAGVPMYLWYPPGESDPQVLPEILSVSLVTGLVEDIL